MNPRVKALIKALFVGGMIYYVTTLITFDDLLVVREGQEVVESQQIEIQGDWRADPVSFLLDGELQVERASRTLQDGRSVDVQPGFLSYLSNLDPSWFALGILCYLATVMIAGGRWWWLLRVNGMNVSLFEALRFTWIGVFFNTVFPGSTGGTS